MRLFSPATLPEDISAIFRTLPAQNWQLNEPKYNKLMDFQQQLPGLDLEDNIKRIYFNHLKQGFENTIDGSPEHGIFVALIKYLIDCNPEFLLLYTLEILPLIQSPETITSHLTAASI